MLQSRRVLRGSSADALLAALGEWARAEASSVRGAVSSNVAPANAYAAKLIEYAGNIGKENTAYKSFNNMTPDSSRA